MPDLSLFIKSRALEERNIHIDSLCSKCRFAHIFRRKGQLNPSVICQSIGAQVAPDIAECSRFMCTTSMDMREMEMLALHVDTRVGVKDGSYR